MIDQASQLKRLRALARTLDSSIPLPGGFRIGLDGIIGLIPVAGDSVGALISSFFVLRAAQLGASTSTLIRMMLNVLLETILGGIPLIGDIFDFAFKSNERNMALLEQNLATHKPDSGPGKRLTSATLALIVAFLVALGIAIWLAVKILILALGVIIG